MTPLAISGEAGCNLETALDHVVSALHARGFNVYSKMDIRCFVPEKKSHTNCVILRALYPRIDTPTHLTDPASRGLIHCSAIIKEQQPMRVWIELSKPIRRLSRKDPETARRADEADRELRSIMTQLVEVVFPLKTA